MLVRVLLQTSLLLWWAQQTLQGGVGPQSLSRVRALPVRGVGLGVKPGVMGALGALGSRHGTKAMTPDKTAGHPLGAHLGLGGYRTLGLGRRTGRYGTPGASAGGLGAGFGLSLGPGFGAALGLVHGRKPVYGAGLGMLPGFGALGGTGYHGARPGYVGGAGNYLGGRPDTWSYAAGLREGALLGAAAGSHAAAALGHGAYPQGYLGAVAGNGLPYGNSYSNGFGAAPSGGAYDRQFPGAYGAPAAGLEPRGGKYGGGAAQVPYSNAPVIPAGLEGDGSYLYAAQQLGLGAEGTETTNKFGAGAGYGTKQTGLGEVGKSEDLGEPAGKYGAIDEHFGNEHKG